MAENDGIAWLGERWPHGSEPVLGEQAGLVFAQGITPQDTGRPSTYERLGFTVTESWDERDQRVCVERPLTAR